MLDNRRILLTTQAEPATVGPAGAARSLGWRRSDGKVSNGGAQVMRRSAMGAMVTAGVLSIAAPAMATSGNGGDARPSDGQHEGTTGSYGAQQGHPGSVSHSKVHVGETVDMHGGGFRPGERVIVHDNDRPVGTVPADEQGDFVSTVTVDACGTNSLTGMGSGPNGQIEVTSTVIGTCAAGTAADAGTTTGAGVADTGTTVSGATSAGTTSAGAVTPAGVGTTVAGASTTSGTTATGATGASTATVPGGTTVASGTTAASGALPRTGTDVALPGLVVGFGLVVAGAGAVAVTRRRRSGGAA